MNEVFDRDIMSSMSMIWNYLTVAIILKNTSVTC